MAAGTDKKISQCTYTGERIKWNFENYSTLHKEKCNILESLKENGYTGINKRSKVRYISKIINTMDLDSVNTRIISYKGLHQDLTDVWHYTRIF